MRKEKTVKSMMISSLKTIIIRDLHKLRSELEAYREETNLWKVEKSIANSGGNLCLHLVGNLNTFIGHELGKISYERNRDQEFSAKGIPREELIARIDDTIGRVTRTLSQLKDEDLEKPYPVMVFGEPMTTGFFLIHLVTHLGYHLGQVNYHRRLLDNPDKM